MAHSVLIRSVKDLELCESCARELTSVEREVMTPLVVASLASYLHAWWRTPPHEPCRHDIARSFWTSLAPFSDAIDHSEVAGALEALIACVPRDLESLAD